MGNQMRTRFGQLFDFSKLSSVSGRMKFRNQRASGCRVFENFKNQRTSSSGLFDFFWNGETSDVFLTVGCLAESGYFGFFENFHGYIS
jgi:hypothetical protein